MSSEGDQRLCQAGVGDVYSSLLSHSGSGSQYAATKNHPSFAWRKMLLLGGRDEGWINPVSIIPLHSLLVLLGEDAKMAGWIECPGEKCHWGGKKTTIHWNSPRSWYSSGSTERSGGSERGTARHTGRKGPGADRKCYNWLTCQSSSLTVGCRTGEEGEGLMNIESVASDCQRWVVKVVQFCVLPCWRAHHQGPR